MKLIDTPQVNNIRHWDNAVWYFLDIIMGSDVPWGQKTREIASGATQADRTCHNAEEYTLDRPVNLLPL